MRLKKSLLMICLLAAIMQAQYISVAEDGANYRQGPGTDYKVFWDFDKGQPLKVLQYTNGWYRTVDYLGHVGWISANMVSHKKVVIVKSTLVNLRQGPGLNYRKTNQAYNGQLFYVLKRTGDWLRVSDLVTGSVAWIRSDLVWGAKS